MMIRLSNAVTASPNVQECCGITPFKGIYTDRLILRAWNERDSSTMCEIMQNNEVNRYLAPHNLDKASVMEAISKSAMANIHTKGYGYFICEEKSTGKVIGMMGLNYTQVANPHFPCYTISWILGREFWRRGFATEGAQALLKYAFEVCKIPKVYACTVAENQSSRSVMERLGMKYVDTFAFPGIELSDSCSTHVLYEFSK